MNFMRKVGLLAILCAGMAGGCALMEPQAPPKGSPTGLITTPPSYYSTAKARYLGTRYKDNLDRLVERIVRNPKTSNLQFANNISSVGGIGFFTHSATKSPDERYLEIVMGTAETFDVKGAHSEKVARLFSLYGGQLLEIMAGDNDIYQDNELTGYGLNLAWRNVIPEDKGNRVVMERAVVYFPKERVRGFLRREVGQNELLTGAVIFAVEEDGPLQLVSYRPEELRADFRPAIREDNLAAAKPAPITKPVVADPTPKIGKKPDSDKTDMAGINQPVPPRPVEPRVIEKPSVEKKPMVVEAESAPVALKPPAPPTDVPPITDTPVLPLVSEPPVAKPSGGSAAAIEQPVVESRQEVRREPIQPAPPPSIVEAKTAAATGTKARESLVSPAPVSKSQQAQAISEQEPVAVAPPQATILKESEKSAPEPRGSPVKSAIIERKPDLPRVPESTAKVPIKPAPTEEVKPRREPVAPSAPPAAIVARRAKPAEFKAPSSLPAEAKAEDSPVIVKPQRESPAPPSRVPSSEAKTPAAVMPAPLVKIPEPEKPLELPSPAKVGPDGVAPKPSVPDAPSRNRETAVEKSPGEQIALLPVKPSEALPQTKPLIPPAPRALEGFVVQLAFHDKEKAQRWAENMERRGYAVSITEAGAEGALRVRLGNFAQRDEAERQLRTFKQEGLNGFVINLPQSFRPGARSSVP